MLSKSNHNGLAYAGGWRSHEAKGGNARSGSLYRLRDESTASGEHGMAGVEEPWRHKADVRGGRSKGDDVDSDEFEIGDEEGGEPINGIRVRTTVTVTEKVDWLDDLY